MKKYVVLFAVSILVSCSNPIKDDLLNYINTELPKVVDYETAAITSWESVSGENYTDDYTMYEELTETIIPNYRNLVKGIESITVNLKTKEVQTLNEKYIEAANIQFNAFSQLKIILETGDAGKIVEFNERTDKGRRLIREWQTELQNLCKKNGITIKG